MLHAKVVKDVSVGFSGVQRQMCLRTAETVAGDLVNFSPGEQTLFLTAVENRRRPFNRRGV